MPTNESADTLSPEDPNSQAPDAVTPPILETELKLADNLHTHVPAESPVGKYLTWACHAQGSPEAYHLANALLFAAHTLTRRGFKLELLLDDVPLTLWFCLLGDSGLGKTTAIEMCRKFAKDVWAEACIDARDPYVEPSGSLPGILAALQEHYDEQRGTTTAILAHDELAQVLNSRDPIGEHLCKIHDSRDVAWNTKTAQAKSKKTQAGKGDTLIQPHVSAMFASTEAQLSEHFRVSHRTGGLFGRLQWIAPPLEQRYVRAGVYSALDVAEARQLRKNAVDAWADWEGQLSALAVNGAKMILSQEAAECWQTLVFGKYKDMLDLKKNADSLHGARMRLAHRTQVIAAIFAGMRGALVVSLEDMQLAAALSKGLYTHIVAAGDLGGGTHNKLCALVTLIVLRAGNAGCERRAVYDHVKTDKKTLDSVFETLIDRETIVPDTGRGVRAKFLHTSTANGVAALKVHRANVDTALAIQQRKV